MRHRYFVHTQYGVIKIKSLSYTCNHFKVAQLYRAAVWITTWWCFAVVLAESLGSITGYLCTQDNQKVVGTEINVSHIRPVSSGKVRGVCSAIHLGRRQQVWSIKIFNEQLRLSSICRLTTVIIK